MGYRSRRDFGGKGRKKEEGEGDGLWEKEIGGKGEGLDGKWEGLGGEEEVELGRKGRGLVGNGRDLVGKGGAW